MINCNTEKKMKLLAHITERNGNRIEQTLKEHCESTARYAASVVKNCGLSDTAYIAGLLHDMGKATKKFEGYLEDVFQGRAVVRGSVNHTFAGVIYLFEKYHTENATAWEKLTSEIISYAIGAHHGLFDIGNL